MKLSAAVLVHESVVVIDVATHGGTWMVSATIGLGHESRRWRAPTMGWGVYGSVPLRQAAAFAAALDGLRDAAEEIWALRGEWLSGATCNLDRATMTINRCLLSRGFKITRKRSTV
jgi:hypothetical protein